MTNGMEPDGPPDEGSWAFARGFRSLLGWSPYQATPAADDRGYLASRLSTWWSGGRRPQGLTAGADSGAGLQARTDDEVPSSDGDAASAPLEGDSTTTPSDHVLSSIPPTVLRYSRY